MMKGFAKCIIRFITGALVVGFYYILEYAGIVNVDDFKG
jgi:hypothetical protein